MAKPDAVVLREQLDECEGTVAELREAVARLEGMVANLRGEIGNLTAARDSLNAQVASLGNELSLKYGEIESLNERIVALEGKVKELNAQLAGADVRVAELSVDVDERDERIAELDAETATKATRIAFLEEAVGLRDASIAELQQKIVGLEGEVDLRDDEISELEARIAELESGDGSDGSDGSGTPEPAPEPEPEPVEPEPEPAPVLGLRVYDCSTGLPVEGIPILRDGESVSIVRSALPADWTLVCEQDGSLSIGSVGFYRHATLVQTENSAPYAYAGDTFLTAVGGVFFPASLGVGSHRIEVFAFSERNRVKPVLAGMGVVLEVLAEAPSGSGVWSHDGFFVYGKDGKRIDFSDPVLGALDNYWSKVLQYGRELKRGVDSAETRKAIDRFASTYSGMTGLEAAAHPASEMVWVYVEGLRLTA